MTLYSSNPATTLSGPNNDGPISLGVQFKVTASGCTLNAIRFYFGGNYYGGTVTAALYAVGGSSPLSSVVTLPSADASSIPAGVTFSAEQALDSNSSTRWLGSVPSSGSPQWLRQISDTATVVTEYKLTPHPSSSVYDPVDFKLQGSNDGSSWTDLDTRTGVTYPSQAEKTFTFSNSTAYTQYRVNITANGGASDFVAVTQFTLTGFTRSMWRTGVLSTPYALTSGTDYRAVLHFTSYRPNANGSISSDLVSGPLTVPSHAHATNGNHTFNVGSPMANPTSSANSNYMLDVIVEQTAVVHDLAGQVDGVSGTEGSILANPALVGQVDAVSATQGAITINLLLEGQVDAVSGLEGAFEAVVHDLDGQVDAVSTVEGALSADLALAGQVDAVSGAQGSLIVNGVDAVESYTHASEDIADPLTLEWEQLESYTEAGATATETITVTVDPVTLRPGYSLKVVDMHGDVLCDLTEASIGTATRALNGRGGLDFSLPKLSAEVATVQQFSEVQLWRGGHLIPGGWFVVVDPGIEIDAHAVGFQCSGLSYYFERRLIGGDRTELLTNGGFESGARYWNFGWTPGGTSGRPAPHTITRDACEGGKALVVYGDSNGHRQYAWQSVDVTNTHPTEPLWVDIQAQCRIDDWDGPNKDGWMLYADVRPVGSSTILYNESVSVDETTPRDRWLPQSVRVKVAADTTSRVTVRLYPPHGSASFDQVSMKADTALIFTKRDPWQVIEGLVAEAQNVTNGKSDLNIGSWGSWSGFKIDRPYPWKDRVKVSEAIDEVVRSRNGPDANMEVGARIRRLTVAPKQGVLYRKPVFALGDRVGDARIVSYSAGIDGDEVTTRAVVQSSWSGGGMSEVIVTSDRDDGLVLETLYQTEQDSPTSTLLEQGRTAVKYGRADVITRVVMHPEDTTTLLPPRGVTIGSVVTLDVHDGEIDVRADYRIVQIDLDPDHDQLSFAVVPEV